MVTTIQIDELLKEKLDSLKIHHRETYNELLVRIIGNTSSNKTEKESLIETIEVISDPETMRLIAQGIEDYQKGKTKTLEQLKKELE